MPRFYVQVQNALAIDTAQIADTATPKVLAAGDSNVFGLGVAAEKSFVDVLDI